MEKRIEDIEDFTCLFPETVSGPHSSKIFQKTKGGATGTDLHKRLGGKNRYWTTAGTGVDRMSFDYVEHANVRKQVVTISDKGESDLAFMTQKDIGVRLCKDLRTIPNIPTNGEEGKRKGDMLIVEYGHYPQAEASKLDQLKLNRAYQDSTSKLGTTGHTYTIGKTLDELTTYPEYEYNGKNYVRIKIPIQKKKEKNDFSQESFEYVWFEVLPVKWMVDEEQKFMTMEKILLPMQFNREDMEYSHQDEYDVPFERSDLHTFIEEHLSRDLEQKVRARPGAAKKETLREELKRKSSYTEGEKSEQHDKIEEPQQDDGEVEL